MCFKVYPWIWFYLVDGTATAVAATMTITTPTITRKITTNALVLRKQSTVENNKRITGRAESKN